jgi:hypothetical protein
MVDLVTKRFDCVLFDLGNTLIAQENPGTPYESLDVQVLPGVQELLDQLHSKVKMAIVSNTKTITAADIQAKLATVGLDKYFQTIIATAEFGTHKPDLLFINLATKQILCAGLGRKNRLIQFDAARYSAGKHEPQIDMLKDGTGSNFDSKYVTKFTALDHDEIIDKLVFNLKTLGDYLLENDSLNFYPEIISSEPNNEGMYEFKDGRDPVDQDGLGALIDSSDMCTSQINESIEAIQVFFPKAEVADLNPEDY